MSVDPAALSIVHYPADILRVRCRPVEQVNDEVRAVARRMIELMAEAEGVGLAAPQVGLPWRLFVCHVPEDAERSAVASPATATARPQVYINPVLRDPAAPLESLTEGCLSLPDISGDVLRPRTITIDALDIEGEPFSATGAGFLARCWQHEVDHLDGVLILDRMSHLSRLRSRSAVRSLERAAGQR
ncbi:MAG TPA: peptide deformylase [Phycisphaerales bacterium]|nr:peptide deformylase [Phycisphaerales bacterium]